MYRIRSSGEVKSQGEIRKMYANTSFPAVWDSAVCEELGIDPILESPRPAVTRYQEANTSGVEQDANGNWVWVWVVTDVSEERRNSIDANQAASVRDKRNILLSETDWRFRSDLNPSQAWIDYCQALRDIPSQAGFPWDVQWPVKPE